MIGTLDSSRREVTVVGAGFAGLLAAYRLDRAGWRVTLLESSDRAGGLIRTTRTPAGIAESAAHSFLATPAVLALCADLGVELIPVRPGSTARYIWREGGLRRFPLGGLEVAQALARAQFVPGDRGSESPEAESLEAWALRHLGKPALDYAIDPFVRGIYAARPSEISVGAAFPRLVVPPGRSLLTALVVRRLARGAGPRKRRSRPPMMAPREGMGSVVARLEERLRDRLGARFRLGTPVTRLPDGPNVVLAVPAGAAASLVEPEDAGFSAALRAVPYAPLASLTVFAPLSAFERPPVGVGVLVPAREERECLGILFNSSAFEGRVGDEGMASFTVMIGGTAYAERVELGDEELAAIARRELAGLLGHRGPAGPFVLHRWPRAIPVYGPALLAAWREARAGWCARPGRVLFGNFTGEVSLRGMIEASESLPG